MDFHLYLLGSWSLQLKLHGLIITWKPTLKKPPSFTFQNSEKNLFWWSLGRIKFNWRIDQIDSDLTFDKHLFSICNKVAKKINVLNRLVNYMSLDKRRMVMKTFIESQYNYHPLIWMFHSRTLNNKINRLHERTLRIVYSDYKSSFCELLEKDKSFSIHHKSIQSLAIEIYKFLQNLSPCIMNKHI